EKSTVLAKKFVTPPSIFVTQPSISGTQPTIFVRPSIIFVTQPIIFVTQPIIFVEPPTIFVGPGFPMTRYRPESSCRSATPSCAGAAPTPSYLRTHVSLVPRRFRGPIKETGVFVLFAVLIKTAKEAF